MRFENVKIIVLTALIIVGLAVHASRSEAAELEVAILAGGCFWCVESDFESVPGVTEVVSGFTGGTVKNPTYKQVSRGGTGHYEAVRITFDPARISYDRILYLFLRSIDPLDAGGQFCDRGDTYRTAIFVRNARQRAAAQKAVAEASAALAQPVVTKILKASPFYPAESYHQNYYRGKRLVLTRRGPKTQASAYRFYRKACGRDKRVRAIWGDAAPFASKH